MTYCRIAALSLLLFIASVPGYAQTAAAHIPGALLDANGQVPTLAPLLNNVTPSVVNISTSDTAEAEASNPLMNDPFFKRFFDNNGGTAPDAPSMPQEEQSNQSIGSGVIVDAEHGYVLTNHHVVEKADEIFVTLKDARRYKAKLLGSDPETDLALLKITAENIQSIPMGDSDVMLVGDFVVAIGNPFGLGQTVTSGIVSALGRSGLGIEGYEDFIQTDASINPGNSGGALINLKGELVGINTAIIAPNGGNVGIGFAIPVNMVRYVMNQLINYGEVKRGRLGIHIQDLTPEIAGALNIDRFGGAVVANVMAESPAAKAGVKTGDVVITMDGKQIRNASDLKNRVGLGGIGDTVTLEIIRDGKKKTIKAVIGKSEEGKKLKAKPIAPKNEIPSLAGAELSEIPAQSPLYGKAKGVYVVTVTPGTKAWNAGVRDADIITSVNQQTVTTPKELANAADTYSKNKNGMLLNIRRDEAALFIVVR